MQNSNYYDLYSDLVEKIKCDIKTNRYWLVYLVLISVIAFGYELFNFSLTIDEELYAVKTSTSQAVGWVQEGRWSMYLLSYLFPVNSIIPFVPMLITLCFSALSFAIVTRVIGFKRGLNEYIAAPFFVACPVLYYSYSFNTLNYGIGIGFFTGALSVLLFTRAKGIGKWVYSSMLMAFSIGIYQALIPWLIVLCLFHMLGKILSDDEITPKELIRHSLHFVLLMALSFIFYYLISKLMYFVLALQPSSYLSGYQRWDLTWSYFNQVITSIKDSMKVYYTGGVSAYYEPISVLGILFSSALLVTIALILKCRRNFFVRMTGALILFLIILTPFSMYFLLGYAMPARTMLAIPLVLSGLILFALTVPYRPLKFLIVVFAIFCAFRFISINNRFAFSDQMAWQADREFTTRIYTEMEKAQESLPVKSDSEQWPLMLVGSHSFKEYPTMVKRETIGESFYSWGSGHIGRALSLMRTMGLHDFSAATFDQQRSVIRHAHEMPVWPSHGAVAVVGGVMVVKIGNFTAPQLDLICPDITLDEVCRVRYQPFNDGVKITLNKSDKKLPPPLIYDYLAHIEAISFHDTKKIGVKGSMIIEPLTPQSTLILPIIDAKLNDISLNFKISAKQQSLLKLFMFKDKSNVGSEIHITIFKGDNSFSLRIPSYLLKTMVRISPSTAPSESLTLNELTLTQVEK